MWRRLVQIWSLFGHAQVVFQLVQWLGWWKFIAVAATTVVASLLAIASHQTALTMYLTMLGSLAFSLWVVSGIATLLHCRSEFTGRQIRDQETKDRLDQFDSLVAGDRDGLARCVPVTGYAVDFNDLLHDRGTRIMLRFDLFNGALFGVTVGDSVDGHIQMVCKDTWQELRQPPEVRGIGFSQPLQLTRTASGAFHLRQWLDPEEVQHFWSRAGATIGFKFNMLSISISTRLERQSVTQRLALPNEIVCQVPHRRVS